MIRRADAYWLSDQTTQTDGQRFQSASAAMVLPARYRYTAMAQSSVHGTPDAGSVFPEESWLTAMSGTFGIMEPFARWPVSVRQQAARAVTRYKEIRHLLDGSVQSFTMTWTSRTAGGRPGSSRIRRVATRRSSRFVRSRPTSTMRSTHGTTGSSTFRGAERHCREGVGRRAMQRPSDGSNEVLR